MSERRRVRLDVPCDNRWGDLEPRDGGRYCAECDRVVVDLMHLTEREALARIDAADGDLCARVREDARGDAVFRREPAARRGVGAVILGAALAACGGGGEAPPEPEPPAPAEPAAPPLDEAPSPEETPTAEAAPAPDEAPEEVEDADEGHDHPAHPGETHTALHTRHHGRMGSVRAIRDRDRGRITGDDPLEGLDL